MYLTAKNQQTAPNAVWAGQQRRGVLFQFTRLLAGAIFYPDLRTDLGCENSSPFPACVYVRFACGPQSGPRLNVLE
jgi:hypothetical protein